MKVNYLSKKAETVKPLPGGTVVTIGGHSYIVCHSGSVVYLVNLEDGVLHYQSGSPHLFGSSNFEVHSNAVVNL